MSKEYPYTAWVLKPSYKPATVLIVKPYGSQTFNGEIAESGKYYALSELFESKDDAITEAKRRIAEQEAALVKKSESLVKKRAAVAKAESEPA